MCTCLVPVWLPRAIDRGGGGTIKLPDLELVKKPGMAWLGDSDKMLT